MKDIFKNKKIIIALFLLLVGTIILVWPKSQAKPLEVPNRTLVEKEKVEDAKEDTKVEVKAEEKKEEVKVEEKKEDAKVENKAEQPKVEEKTSAPVVENNSQPVAPSVSQQEVPKPVSPSVQTVVKEETETIPYSVSRRHVIPNSQTRVAQKGVNGSVTYKVTYQNGQVVSKQEINRVNPTNEIIETYVKVRDKVVETREVDDLSQPVYEIKDLRRWFVKNMVTGEVLYFYTELEAYQTHVGENELGYSWKLKGYTSSWGTAESETIRTDKIMDYRKKIEQVVVQEEKWEWQ